MRLRWFLFGMFVGLVCAPGRGSETVRQIRDRLAGTIDAVLRIGLSDAS